MAQRPGDCILGADLYQHMGGLSVLYDQYSGGIAGYFLGFIRGGKYRRSVLGAELSLYHASAVKADSDQYRDAGFHLDNAEFLAHLAAYRGRAVSCNRDDEYVCLSDGVYKLSVFKSFCGCGDYFAGMYRPCCFLCKEPDEGRLGREDYENELSKTDHAVDRYGYSRFIFGAPDLMAGLWFIESKSEYFCGASEACR